MRFTGSIKISEEIMGRDEGLEKFKGYILYGSLGLGSAIGSILLIRYFIQKVGQNQVQKKSLTEGDPASYATQLYMAMGNEHFWNLSNSKNILNIIRSISSKDQFVKVQQSYKTNYKNNLSADLEQRLSPADYITATLLISAKA